MGCGSGQLSKTLLDEGYHVVAINTDAPAVEKLHGRKESRHSFLTLAFGKPMRNLIARNSRRWLEHIEDDKTAVRSSANAEA